MTSYAGKIRSRGASLDEMVLILTQENQARCKPPLPQAEVDSIAKSISRYPSEMQKLRKPEISEAAFLGLPGKIVEMIDPHTESSRVGILGQLLLAFGNVIDRRKFYQVEATKHYMNLFILLVGDTSKGRKGTSWNQVKRLFQMQDSGWAGDRIMSGLSSGEGLIANVCDPDSDKSSGAENLFSKVNDKRLLIIEAEFSGTLKVGRREGNTLSPIIRDAWDNGSLRTLTKNNPLKATDAHISIIGHITKDELLRNMGDMEANNGFANRFLYLFVERSKLLPEGGNIESVDFTDTNLKIEAAVSAAKNVARIRFDDVARALWNDIYSDLSEGKGGLLGAVTARSEAQVIRLASLYALFDSQQFIGETHLKAGLALWKYSEASCEYIFGSTLGSPIADKLTGALVNAGSNGMSRTEIRDLFKRNRSESDISSALELLKASGQADSRNVSTGGRTAEYWFSTGNPTTETTNHARWN